MTPPPLNRLAVPALLLLVACTDSSTAPPAPIAARPNLRYWFTQQPCDATSEISSNFNGTPIPAGDFIWFNAALDLKGRTGAATVSFVDQTVTAGGSTLMMPDAVITFDASATSATTVFNAVTNAWNTTVPVGYQGKVFVGGTVVPVQNNIAGGVNPVAWGGMFASSTRGLTFQWQWAGAVYTMFGVNADAGVKPIDANTGSAYLNSDHAGTPESFKEFVTGGARGGGGSNWTGSYSGTASAQCQ